MKTRAHIALALGGGYLLGRTKKLKLAMTVAGLAAGRRFVGTDGLISRGFETLRAAPEFEDVRGQVLERLVAAGRTAALTTASNALGRVTARVNGSSLGASQSDGDDSDDDADEGRDEAETSEGGDRDDVYDEPEEADEDDGDQADHDDSSQPKSSGKASTRKRTSGRSSARRTTSKRSNASAGARSGGDNG